MNNSSSFWNLHNLALLASIVCFILAAFVFHGSSLALSGASWASLGAACFVAASLP